jgi:hypothetical protein
MAWICEVCAALSSSTEQAARTGSRLVRVLLDQRVVALCDAHAEAARAGRAKSLADLRALFPEQYGRRSLVDRRASLDRRAFPPRPEGRRSSSGRRLNDPE